jgi:uncharacterized protein YndB with AHSA1/START domain
MKSSASIADSATQGGDYQATMNINASPDAVFEALATTAGLSGWWSVATGSGSTGGELVFRFGDRRKFIHVDNAERPSRVRWNVRISEPSPEWNGTAIAFDLTSNDDDQTRLRFRHHGLTPQLECFGDCSVAWATVLGSLVNYVETGQGHPFSTPDKGDTANG